MCSSVYVCMYVYLSSPLDLPIWINELSLESYQSSGCYMLYIVQKKTKWRLPEVNMTDKNKKIHRISSIWVSNERSYKDDYENI